MDEKQGFSTRLRQALQDAGVELRSPTRVAVQFNLRHHGSLVTTQGVRKWPEGSSIPTQDKIRTLGKWLKVSSEWLRYGDREKRLPQRAIRAAGARRNALCRSADRVAGRATKLRPRHS